MPASPEIDAEGPVRVVLQAAGTELSNTVQLLRLEVHRAVNAIPWARIEIEDGDIATQSFEVADGTQLVPGTEVTVQLGYGDTQESVFTGVVVRFGVKIDSASASRLVVECRDKAAAMTLGRRHRVFIDQTDSDIWSTLIGEHGLTPEVDATTVQHGELVQHDCSDWDFLLARAEANGCVVVVTDGTVSIKPPATSDEAVLSLTYGVDLMAFDADIDARTQVASVKALSWDPKTATALTAEAAPESLGLQGDIDGATLAEVLSTAVCELRSSAAQSQEVLTAWAKAQQTKAGLARVRGRLRCQGSALAQPGSTIEVAGVGTRFAGKVYGGSVRHEVAAGNWFCDVEFGLAPQWRATREHVTAPPAAALLPGVAGLQIGVVTKLDADPVAGHRVQLRVPALQAEATPVWARLLSPYASNGFGLLLLPEIGDEVLVGHLADDPAHPVVLGSLYSAKHAPPVALEAENKLKVLWTRCKHKLEFDDDKKIITLTTPAGNKLVFSDEDKKITLKDQTGNLLEFSESGIKLDSPKDITIQATGKIDVKATGAISIKSDADVKVDGLNVQATAQVGFTAKGNASAELSASGQTTVKGAMVMIN